MVPLIFVIGTVPLYLLCLKRDGGNREDEKISVNTEREIRSPVYNECYTNRQRVCKTFSVKSGCRIESKGETRKDLVIRSLCFYSY